MIDVRFHPKIRGISASFVRRAIQAVLASEKQGRTNVSVYVTTNADIRKINQKHLRHDYATDVLSFGAEEKNFLGDVVVSADYARAYSKENGLAFREELARYLVHGTLHLLGYDDQKPAAYQKMHRRQEAILMKAKFIRSRKTRHLFAGL